MLEWPKSFSFVSRSHPDGIEVPADVIACRAIAIRDMLRENGVGTGDRVGVWLSDGASLVATIFGCWAAGVTFSILPSFAGRSNSERSRARVGEVMETLRPKLLLVARDAVLPEALAGLVPVVSVPDDAYPNAADTAPEALDFGRDDDDIAFIQFTSGSTGGAKGAVVRFGQLKANLETIAKRTQIGPDDRMVSWAPLYHDMGLMAVLLPLSVGAGLVLMETEHFVRRPAAWLETLSRHRGTISTAPPTALKLVSRRRARDVDLSAWRYAWIGGEAVFPGIVRAFEETYAEAGLRPGVIQPTYGMAETVVGISCGIPGEPWSVQDGFISCGPPLDGLDVRIADAAGLALADGETGRILVRGESVMRGYYGLEPFAPDAWFDTGDLGFLSDGRIFVTGRVKDVLKRGAETFPASVVEAAAEAALALNTGRCAAFANRRDDADREEIVLLVESRDWDDARANLVACAVASELGLQLDVVRNALGGRLPRTSSGKLMRQKAASLYREGGI